MVRQDYEIGLRTTSPWIHLLWNHGKIQYFAIVVAPEFSKKAYQEAESFPRHIRLSSEGTIVKDVGELVMGELITTEGVSLVIRRMEMEVDGRMQRMKEEERSEREKIEQRVERLEMESEGLKRNNVELRKELIEAQMRVWQAGFFVMFAFSFLCIFYFNFLKQ